MTSYILQTKDYLKALGIGGLSFALSVVGFAFVEPAILGAVEDQFEITQTVTSEVSVKTTADDVTMSPSIPGLSGGTANGQTYIVIETNDSAGYSMTIKASSSPAMQGDTQGGDIDDYSEALADVPDYTFSVPANGAEFGYTVSASTTADLSQIFKDDGLSSCNEPAGSDTNASDTCWLGLSTSQETIINRTSETGAGGATTTIFFRVQIQSNPSPAVPEDTYTATTTLTATTN